MDMEKNTFELIELTYDAVLAPEKWQQVMEMLIKTVGTHTAILREANYAAGAVGLFNTVGFDPCYVAAYRKHFVHLDYFATHYHSQKIGEISRGDCYVPWEQQRNTEFYNDYIRAQKNRYCLGITLGHDQDHHLLLALQRTKQQGQFTEQDLQLIRRVVPHMTRAMSIYRQTLSLTTQQQWALSALDQLSIGVILLNDQGTPLFTNQKADRLMAENCGLYINREAIVLTNKADNFLLKRFLANAALVACGRQYPAGGSLRTTNSLGVAIDIQVFPLPRDKSEKPWGLSLPGSCIGVFFSASGMSELHAETLSAVYGLTPAEAKLTMLLAQGRSLDQSSIILKVSIQTLRSRLKDIFSKTQVSRQAELVALLLNNNITGNYPSLSFPHQREC